MLVKHAHTHALCDICVGVVGVQGLQCLGTLSLQGKAKCAVTKLCVCAHV